MNTIKRNAIKKKIRDGSPKSIAWGNALRYEIAEQVRNDGFSGLLRHYVPRNDVNNNKLVIK